MATLSELSHLELKAELAKSADDTGLQFTRRELLSEWLKRKAEHVKFVAGTNEHWKPD